MRQQEEATPDADFEHLDESTSLLHTPEIHIEERGDCAFCGEPIPPGRPVGAETCSDGCARSMRRKQDAEAKAAQERQQQEEAGAALQPEPDLPPVVEEFYQAAPLNKDYDRCVQERWIDGQTFIEVRKWDYGDLSQWSGDPGDSRWVVVPPTREFAALNSSQLQHRILRHSPIGGHFQVRLFQMGAHKPNLCGGPFYFHFSPVIPKESSGMADILPLIQQSQQAQERERERHEAALREAQAKEGDHLSRLLSQQERAAEQARRDNEILRRELAQSREREEQRRLQERQFQMEQETRRIEATQQSQANGMGQLSNTLSQMFAGNGGMMGGQQQTMAMFGAMFQAQMEQSRIDREMQMERMRLERETNAKHMELMISLMQGKEPDQNIKDDLRRMEDRYDRLQERYLDTVERKNGIVSTEQGDQFDQFLNQAEKFQKLKGLFGGEEKDTGAKDMFDRALDLLDRVGAEEIGKAAARRLASGAGSSDSEDSAATSRGLPPADTTPPADQNMLPSGHAGGEGPQLQPHEVQNPQDLIIACATAINNNMPARSFAELLPEEARRQLKGFDVGALLAATKHIPGMNTPRARRWIEDAHGSIRLT